jgi:hypothetical protein
LVEIFQSKGNSECLNSTQGDTADADCNLEIKLGPGSKNLKWDNLRSGYVRPGLQSGLKQYEKSGINSFQMGFVGGTDMHNATAGVVKESEFDGVRPAIIRLTNEGLKTSNPGGLTAVWAEANTREDIFTALRRRETYATSGPRIALKFYETRDHKAATSMGGVLRPLGRGQKPEFVIEAVKDEINLGRAEIIKSSVEGGKVVEKIIAFPAKDAVNGDSKLYVSWTDEDYDSKKPTFWYARVTEIPSKRWSKIECEALEHSNPNFRCDPKLNRMIQERAWASPIWNLP